MTYSAQTIPCYYYSQHIFTIAIRYMYVYCFTELGTVIKCSLKCMAINSVHRVVLELVVSARNSVTILVI